MSGLSRAEHKAMDLTAQLWNLMVADVIGDGAPAEQDRREFAAQIHAVQHAILRQAAARAHPDLYRLLGESLPPVSANPPQPPDRPVPPAESRRPITLINPPMKGTPE